MLWEKLDVLAAEQAAAKEKEGKQITAAHVKIRDLETWKWKAWAASAAATFLGIVVVELLRLLFKGK